MAKATSRCQAFHGADACDRVTERKLWMPGPLVLVGECLDCGYEVTNRRSSKAGRYVHDHKASVRVYRRARRGEHPNKTLKRQPKELFVLGDWLGCTYRDADGEHEIKSNSRVKACTADGKTLYAIHTTKGCLYVISGGKFRIKDWMYN